MTFSLNNILRKNKENRPYSIPGVFCLSGGGGDSFLFIQKETTTTVLGIPI